MSGTINAAKSHSPSSVLLIQGSKDDPGVVAKLATVGVAVDVVTLLFRCWLGVVINGIGA